MPTSPRMGWPYPAEQQDPFFASFESMVQAQDASVFGTREDRNLLVMRGGSVSFTASSGLLSWTDTIELNSAVTGFLWSIAAGSVTLLDGQYLFTRLVRSPITNTSLTAETASKLPDTDPDRPLVIGLRRGNRVYFRDGKVLLDGQTLTIFETMPTGGGGGVGSSGQRWREHLALATNEATNSVTPMVVGTASLDSDDFTLSGTNKSFTFSTIGNVTDAGTSGTVQLYNLSLATVAATISFTGADLSPTKKTASATVNTTEHIYEVRIFRTAGTGTLVVQWSGIYIDNVVI